MSTLERCSRIILAKSSVGESRSASGEEGSTLGRFLGDGVLNGLKNFGTA